jgi:hypothetical protein
MYLHSFPSVVYQSLTHENYQESAYPKTSVQGWTAQEGDAGRCESQGREEEEAHEGWGQQAEGGEEEAHSCRATIGSLHVLFRCCVSNLVALSTVRSCFACDVLKDTFSGLHSASTTEHLHPTPVSFVDRSPIPYVHLCPTHASMSDVATLYEAKPTYCPLTLRGHEGPQLRHRFHEREHLITGNTVVDGVCDMVFTHVDQFSELGCRLQSSCHNFL